MFLGVLRARGAAVLALIAVVGSTGCKQLLGLTEDTVVSEAGAGIEAGSDAGADTGTKSDGGGDADADSSAPALCGQGLPTASSAFQELVKTCVLANSCNPNGFGGTASNCVTEDVVHSSEAPACLATITDCAGYGACTGVMSATPAECPTTAEPAHCSGGSAVTCYPTGKGTGIAIACDKLGASSCGTYASDAGTIADCVVLPSCSNPTDGKYYCSGDILYTCVGGRGFGMDCSVGNAACIADDPSYGTGCIYKGPACSPPNTQSCDHNLAVACGPGDMGVAFDCATAGLACVPDADDAGTAECLAPGCSYEQSTTCVESCSGSVANLCVGGAPYAFDCATLGGTFTTCAELKPVHSVICH